MEELNNQPENNEDKNNNNIPDDLSHINPQVSPVAAGFFGLIGGFFLYQLVGALLTYLIFGLNIDEANVNAVRLMTTGSQILFILLPALLFAKWFYEDVGTIIRFKMPDWQGMGLFIIGIIILTPVLENYMFIQNYFFDQLARQSEFINSLKSLLDKLNELVEKTYGNLLRANNIFEGLLVVIVIAITPAVCEEVMFRGFIQRSFEFKLKPFTAALLTAIFFGIYHFNPYGLLPLIALGLYFGFAAYMSNSILIPIVLHFLNNLSAIIFYYIIGDDALNNSAVSSEVDLQSSIFIFFISLILFIGVIFIIKRYYSQKK